ncbi:hypothetical protein [Cellulosimicrobium sp. TH-20]|uniref:hypothetical protein n=1 Tax=Cellulosimicrobium sp. TH-20 TaxID=1980001 RepID=UPI0012FBE682|nr:hypothetical protein [Cellulosimicrobium sp. TH-20]
MKTAMRATVTHDRETWDARLMRMLSGRDANGRPLSSKAVVLAIDPDARTLYTRGGSGWSPVAQVHGISDVEWADLEHQDCTQDDLSDVISVRGTEGWTLYETTDLADDSESVRAFFTRPLD